jgi:HlyD family secretion protein
MDISRPDIKNGGDCVFCDAAEAGAPEVDRATVWTDTVKRGRCCGRCAGRGRWCRARTRFELIPAQTDATVVRIRVLPGAKVTPDTILMDLADPQLQQQLLRRAAGAEGREGGLQEPAGDAAEHADGQEGGGGAGELRLHAGPAAGADGQAALRPGRDQRAGTSASKNKADQLTTQNRP